MGVSHCSRGQTKGVNDAASSAWYARAQEELVLKIQSGITDGSKDHIEWELHKKAGLRTWSTTVEFKESFSVPPTVVASLSKIDVHKDKNLRVAVRALHVDARKFVIEFRTWGDTFVHAAQASWIAYGP
jgi:hypothetical protein